MYINVINIQSGQVITKIHSLGTFQKANTEHIVNIPEKVQNRSMLENELGQKKYDQLMGQVTALHFDHAAHQMVTGH